MTWPYHITYNPIKLNLLSLLSKCCFDSSCSCYHSSCHVQYASMLTAWMALLRASHLMNMWSKVDYLHSWLCQRCHINSWSSCFFLCVCDVCCCRLSQSRHQGTRPLLCHPCTIRSITFFYWAKIDGLLPALWPCMWSTSYCIQFQKSWWHSPAILCVNDMPIFYIIADSLSSSFCHVQIISKP